MPTATTTRGRKKRPARSGRGAGSADSTKFAERAETFALACGAQLQFLATPGTGTVVIRGTLRAGGALDPKERPGLAELTARALDTGTRRRSRMEVAEALDSRGVSVRFVAGVLTAAFGARCIAEDFAVTAEAIFEMLREPTFPEEEISRLRGRVVGQLRQSADSTRTLCLENFYRALYPPAHALWTPPLEDRIRSVEQVTSEELRTFHGSCYGPSDLIMTVVGDIEGDEVRRRMEAFTSGWTGPLRHSLAWDDDGEHPHVDEPIISIAMPGKSNVDVLWGHATELRRDASDYIAATLGNAALGGSTLSSRLGERVRDIEGLTYGIYSRFLGATLVSGPWVVSVTVAPENLERALVSSADVVEKTLRKGISREELESEQEQVAGSFLVGLATNDGIAHELHDAAFYGLGPAWLDEFTRRVRAVTHREANKALRRYIRPQEAVTVACGPI